MLFKRKIEDHVAEKIATKTFDEMKRKKSVKKTSLIRDILENTDDYELVARKEGEEFVVRVRKPALCCKNDVINEHLRRVDEFERGLGL